MEQQVDRQLQGMRIHIDGIVQGVGFRPFVYALAQRHQLRGWVKNTSAGVDIEVDGNPEKLEEFVHRLEVEAPPLARIDAIVAHATPAMGLGNFEIIPSTTAADEFQPISPDVSLCQDCRNELFDPEDRRFRYPFINCTNCGPRFTIITDLPYDRPLTTMADFEMCPACRSEYGDPLDRRFHAQPTACPDCGPRIWLSRAGQEVSEEEEALQSSRQILKDGKILAIKGLGGFHLACDASNDRAIERLRQRKGRPKKPLAIMMPDLDAIRSRCIVSAEEESLLRGPSRPIVLLKRQDGSDLAAAIAPYQTTIGVMLPYTPLHELILEREDGFPLALIMTSGNRSGEPIEFRNGAALERLGQIADAFLLHDRDIQMRCDDSVVREFEQVAYPIRRSRGLAPEPLRLHNTVPPLLAVGAELKNTFCLTREDYTFLSQHQGDLDSLEALQAYEESVEHFEHLFRIRPQALALDLHPDYLSTRYARVRAEAQRLPMIRVQHHHAHLAACLTENEMAPDEPAIGLIFDGTGYGDDGAIWGGEVLLGDVEGVQRAFHLNYIPLPGGDASIRHPWRTALSWLHASGVEWEDDLPSLSAIRDRRAALLKQQIEAGVNCPPTSSMGRLFDAVASIIGLRHSVTYEAQAAIELEATIDPEEAGVYNFALEGGIMDARPLIRDLVTDLRGGATPGRMAARFHNTLAAISTEVCDLLRRQSNLETVALSGGVWQNYALLSRVVSALRAIGFHVLVHRRAPANDGGISLGQAAVASSFLARGEQEPAVGDGRNPTEEVE